MVRYLIGTSYDTSPDQTADHNCGARPSHRSDPQQSRLRARHGRRWVNTTFVVNIDNVQHFDPSDIYVSFVGSYPQGLANQPAQTYGKGNSLGGGTFQSYPLTSLATTLPNTNYGNNTVHSFSLNNVISGRVYFSYGKQLTQPPTTTYSASPYGYVEYTVLGQNQAAPTPSVSNIDVSYVSGIGFPINVSINSNKGIPLPATTVNPVNTTTNLVYRMYANAVLKKAALITPLINGYRYVAQIPGPNFAKAGTYPAMNALIQYLQTTTQSVPLKVASFVPQAGDKLGGTNFGYGGVSSGGLNPAFRPQQRYSFKASFQKNLNPNPSKNPAFNQFNQAIPNGTAGAYLVQQNPLALQIYVTNSEMTSQTGIYGQNAGYWVVYWPSGTIGSGTPSIYSTNGLANDLTGRVVGDLLAGMDFGWASSTVRLQAHAVSTSTEQLFTNTPFQEMSAGVTVNQLSTGQYWYLLSIMNTATQVGDWVGADLNPSNAKYYDVYNDFISDYSLSYGTALGDRKQGFLSPNPSWYTNNPPQNPNSHKMPPANFPTVGYVQISLCDAYLVPASTQ